MAAMTVTRAWTLTINAPAPMYTENTREHWRKTAAAVKEWRAASFTYAHKAKLPTGLNRVRIDVVLHFTDTRDRDTLNLHKYVVKPLVDGLSKSRTVKTKTGVRVEPGYQLIPDDNPRHLDGPYPLIGAPVSKKDHPYGLAVITITDISEESSHV
jgi:hypothetical protein